MVAPYALVFLAFMVAPSVYGLYISFTDYRLGSLRLHWIGLDNFWYVLTDPLFQTSVKNTIVFVLESTPALIALPLGLAVVLNRGVPLRDFLRGAFFLPFTLSVSVVSICWWWLLDANFGPVYFYLTRWGLHPPVWLGHSGLAMAAVVLATVWWTAGYNMVLFLAGLQDIPLHLYEAARMDGAGGWRQFRAITLPLLRPTMLFVVVIQVIASFQLFGQVYVMTQGGPGDSTRTVIQHVYETAFVQQRMAEGSAAAWVLFIIILVFSLVQFRVLAGHTEY
ncbi:MAG TPA: sugar ABC transporter permease [bacterium]|nr:sugar ABC transporter permease [bacterium]